MGNQSIDLRRVQHPDDVKSDLLEKIKSKIEVAKFFAGFMSVLMGILLSKMPVDSGWSELGILSMLLSLGFCVAAVSAYDHLLTPELYLTKTYWTDMKDGVELQTFLDRLAKHMVWSWRFLFVPTILFFGLGLSFLLVHVLDNRFQPTGWSENKSKVFLCAVLLLGFLAPTGIYFLIWRLTKYVKK